jgi:biotin-(acetyl-CoA carboxylase) ligase
MHRLAETKVDPEFLPGSSSVVSLSLLPPAERALWARFSRQTELRISDPVPNPVDIFWNSAILIQDSSQSQFDELVACSRENPDLPNTIACLAMRGSGFHGNRDRVWNALPGNLHLSSYCRMTLNAADCGPTLSMLPTVAVTDALISLFSQIVTTDRSAEVPTPWIKWVNDVCLDHSKISGSLVSTQVEGEQITSFVLGIGLNVGAAPTLADDAWAGPATSLAGQGIDVALPNVFRELLKTLAHRICEMRDRAGRAAIFRAYQERLGGVGSHVQVFPESFNFDSETLPIASGRLIGVHPDLSIQIEGCPELIRSGRLRMTGK